MDPSHLLHLCQENLSTLEGISPIAGLQVRLSSLNERINHPDLWSDPKTAASIMKEHKEVSSAIEFLTTTLDYIQLYAASMNELSDKDVVHIQSLNEQLSAAVFKQMMNGPVDNSPAIITINAGSGGLEAANWTSMLYRMYARYADRQGFRVELLDEKPSEEHSAICTDSVSIRVEGQYAFGYFKSESGVHRLQRNSPFGTGARHTSFAAVCVSPDIEDVIDIRVEEKDLEITTMRCGGPGGQATNKVSSAVRMRHIPSGIVINSRGERSQHTNRNFAMKMLKAKLYDLELQKKKEAQDKQVATQAVAAFGSQIRTTTLTPYTMVKDHRTGYETADADGVLDGDVDELMQSYLKWNAGAK